MRFCNTPQTDCGGGRRGDSATVRVLRCSWNCGSARIAAAESRGDAESASPKNSRLLEQVRRNSSGQSVSERVVSESSASTSAAFRYFGKIRLSSRRLPFAPILLGKAASARAQRVRCVASACEISRRKRPTAHAGNMSSLSIGYTALSRRACGRLQRANGLVARYKYALRRQRV